MRFGIGTVSEIKHTVPQTRMFKSCRLLLNDDPGEGTSTNYPREGMEECSLRLVGLEL